MKSRPVCTTLVLLFLLLGFERAAYAQYSGGSGGTVTTSGGYTVHTFTGSGTFTSNGSGNIEVLVVAGGGGGGNGGGSGAGGGGGGGVAYSSSHAVTGRGYTVTIGSGGAGSTAYTLRGQNGGDSVFSSITAVGGGGGGSHGAYAAATGASGGSGGGSGGPGNGSQPSGGSGTSGQGTSGGSGIYIAGGGGGGAGAAGANAGTNAGNGGAGSAYSINGTSTYYGGGGGGGLGTSSATYGSGGAGGGGNGEKRDSSNCVAGSANTGGGGGGHSASSTVCAGGSGVVIIRYPTPSSSPPTLSWKRDHVFAGPGGGEIAMVTPAPSDTTAPGAPSSAGTTSTTATSVALSWTGSSDSGGSGMAGYKVYRQKGSGASLPVGTVNSSTTAFTDQPLQSNTAYTYTIVAFDNAQNHSSASNSVSVTTSAAGSDTTAPSVPANLSGSLLGRNSIRVTWTPSTDIGGTGMQGYKVYRDNTLVSGSSPITATYFDQTGLSYKTAYAYKVEAVDNSNNVSSQTSAVNVTTDRQLLVSDNFNRPDTSSLASPWGYLNGYFYAGFNLQNGSAWGGNQDYSTWGYQSHVTTSYSDVKVTADVVRNAGGFAGLVLFPELVNLDPECEDEDWWECNVFRGYYVYLGTSTHGLVYCDDFNNWGTCHNPASGTSWTGGPVTGTLSAELTSSGNIKVYLNGTLKINASISTGTMNGAVGIVGMSNVSSGVLNSPAIDNFTVERN